VSVTLGIDLASQPATTAVCAVTWAEGTATVALRHGRELTDAELIRVIDDERPAKVGIDAPLGWPVAFVRAVSDLDAWPVAPDGSRAALERRATDHWIRGTTERLGLPPKLPLSVTTDRIAYPAMRAVGLLAHLARSGHEIDRSGVRGLVCETYPDPTIRTLGLWPAGAARRASYKRAATGVRAMMLDTMAERAPWLQLTDAQRRACVDSDDCLDALVCALAARAAALGLTFAPPRDHVGVARAEGWIHLPRPGALEGLV
jgi:hypothetical protein